MIPRPADACEPADERGGEATALPIDHFDRLSNSLYRWLVAQLGGDANLGDDLMQQAWLRTSQSTTMMRRDEAEAWLRTVLMNLARDHWRRLQRQPPSISIDPCLASTLVERLSTQALPTGGVLREEEQRLLIHAITELPSAQQELIIAFYVHGRSHAQLAVQCGGSPRAIEGRLRRARQALRDTLLGISKEEGD